VTLEKAMGLQDIRLLALTLIPVVVLVIFAALAPLYRMPNGSYERHWVWNAPTMKVGHGFDLMKQEDIDRLNQIPEQKRILDNMKAMPREIPITPVYLGSRRGADRNVLGWLAMFSVIGWVFFAGSRWFNR
jgi:hypothetical protein